MCFIELCKSVRLTEEATQFSELTIFSSLGIKRMSAEKVNRFWASLLTIHSLLGGTILLIIEPWLMMGHLWLVNIEKYGYALF